MWKHQLNNVRYLGVVAPLLQLQDGEISHVAVTEEVNGYMVWYGFKDAETGGVGFDPTGGLRAENGGAMFTGETAREMALEHAVMLCGRAHARHVKRNPPRDN